MFKQIVFILLFITALSEIAASQTHAPQRIVAGRKNSAEQKKKPYVILISADGFRYDYAKKYQANDLIALADQGVKAESMIPSFPAATQANHFAMVSGLYPAHNGIVGNAFYDPARGQLFKPNDGSWYAKDPIWISAEKQGMITASLNFIATQPAIHKTQTTYFYKFGKVRETAEQRAAIVKDWLNLPEDERPHFIAFYIPEADHAGHQHGPDSKEVEEAVHFVNEVIVKLNEAVKSTGLPVNMVFVSDHGMTAIDRAHHLALPVLDSNKFTMVDQGAHVNIHSKNPADILPLYDKLKAEKTEGYDVYLKKDLPADLHYGAQDDSYNRVGDLVLLAKWPKVFTKNDIYGAHGFNPHQVKDMHSTFYAWGPAFKNHVEIKPFQNVEVYGMIMKILGLTPEPNDGTGLLAKEILK